MKKSSNFINQYAIEESNSIDMIDYDIMVKDVNEVEVNVPEDAKDTINSTTSFEVSYETKAVVKDIPTRIGFTFGGWSDKKVNGNILSVDNNPLEIYKPIGTNNATYTIYATWNKKKTVTLSSAISTSSTNKH